MSLLLRISFLVSGFWLLITNYCFAEKITILYTGQTHASLYHCDCPKEPDGGIARRMTKLKELRLENPQALLVDSGGFFAGGMFDEHSRGVELDKVRNEINLKALELMAYDALNVGDDEFNFGKDYLSQKMKESRVPFLSANLKAGKASPYLLKKIGKTNIAIIGLTNDEARAKSGGLEIEEALSALAKNILLAKKNKADLVLALSYSGEEKDKELIRKVKGIDILICGRPGDKADAFDKVDSAYIVRPAWQGRRLSKIDFEFEDGVIKNFKLEQIRLSNQISDAPEITKLLPECFADSDCQKAGQAGSCNNPAKLEAKCIYQQTKPLSLLIIQPKNVRSSNQEQFIGSLKNLFPGLAPDYIDADSKIGQSWLNKTRTKLLPVYLLAKEIDTTAGFKNIKEFVELQEGDYYYISPRLAGGSIFVGRKIIPKRLDVFIGTKGKDVEGILSVLKELQAKHKELKVNIHFLAVEGEGGFSVPGGLSELEEDIRQACVRHYYPVKFWDYALCRARNQESSWWDLCAEQFGINAGAIKKCSLSREGLGYLRENTSLNKELEVVNGPTFLVNNYEIFSAKGIPKVEDLEKRLGMARLSAKPRGGERQ